MAKRKSRAVKAKPKRKAAKAREVQKDLKPLDTVLPPELQTLLCSFLDPVASTCLGLICKLYYSIHVKRYGLGLPVTTSIDPPEGGPARLKGFLYAWMPADMRYYNPWTGKFGTLERLMTALVEKGNKNWERAEQWSQLSLNRFG